MKKLTFIVWLILIMALVACEAEEVKTAPIPDVATLAPPPDLTQDLAAIEPFNAGAIELLGVVEVGPITSVALAPNNMTVAIGTDTGSVRVVSLEDGQVVHNFAGHKAEVRGLAYDPSGERLASADEDGVVIIWQAQQGGEGLTLKGHSDWVRSLAFSPDGQMLASAGADNTIRLWGTLTGQLQNTFDYPDGSVRVLTFSADGRYLNAGGRGDTVRRWNLESGFPKGAFAGHDGAVLSLIDNGRLLISGGFDGAVLWWNTQTRSPKPDSTFNLTATPVRALALNQGATVLMMAFQDGTIRLWDTERDELVDREEIRPIDLQAVELIGAGFMQDDELLVGVTASGQIWLWGAKPGARPSPTPTATRTPTPTLTPTKTLTPTPTDTPTPSDTPTITLTPTRTNTPEPTDTPEPTAIETEEATEPPADSTPATTQAPTATPTVATSPTPSRTPTETLTPTPTVPPCTVVPRFDNVNVRSGPGTGFRVIAVILQGNSAEVDAQTTGLDGFVWWRVVLVDEEEPYGWARSDTVTASESCPDVPVVEPET